MPLRQGTYGNNGDTGKGNGRTKAARGRQRARPLQNLAMLSSIGIAFVAATFIGLAIGIYLDRYFGTAPWLTVIFLVFGIAAGFKNVYDMIKKYGSSL